MHGFYFKKILNQVKQVHSSIENRAELRDLRKDALENIKSQPIIKVAFDTRRINQDTDYNPRRNLQYYHRSEPFISENSSNDIKLLFKLKVAVDNIKEDFVGDPDWFDSYCRILSATVDKTLRTEQKDMDLSTQQIDYLKELLYLRYRINNNDLESLNEKELRNIILSRDEKLLYKQIYSYYNNGGLKKDSNQLLNNKESNNINTQHVKVSNVKNTSNESKIGKDSNDSDKSISITINVNK